MSRLIILSGILLILFLSYVFFSSKQISDIRKEKQLTIHDTMYEPKPAYFIFHYFGSGSFDTLKNGTLVTDFYIYNKSDTVGISGELFIKIKQLYKEHLDSINKRAKTTNAQGSAAKTLTKGNPTDSPSKINETFIVQNNLHNLLVTSDSLYKMVQHESNLYPYKVAKELLKTNSEILELLKTNSGYLASNLTPKQIDAYQRHLESWIADCNKVLPKDNPNIDVNSKYLLKDHIAFPKDDTRQRIDAAFELIRKR